MLLLLSCYALATYLATQYTRNQHISCKTSCGPTKLYYHRHHNHHHRHPPTIELAIVIDLVTNIRMQYATPCA